MTSFATPMDEGRALQELRRLRENLGELLRRVGRRAVCDRCTHQVFWILCLDGKKRPYDGDGVVHRCRPLSAARPVVQPELFRRAG